MQQLILFDLVPNPKIYFILFIYKREMTIHEGKAVWEHKIIKTLKSHKSTSTFPFSILTTHNITSYYFLFRDPGYQSRSESPSRYEWQHIKIELCHNYSQSSSHLVLQEI